MDSLKMPAMIDKTDLRKMKKAEIIEEYDRNQLVWRRFCVSVAQELSPSKDPDYQEMKMVLDKIQDVLMVRLSKQEKEIQELRADLEERRKWQKPGRPSLDPEVVKRIRELKAEGLSIRAIVNELKEEGIQVSKGSVWNTIKE